MAEFHVRIFLRHLQHVRVEIAERGREDQSSAIQVDHAFHGLLDVGSFGDLLFLDHFDAAHLANHRRGLGMGLIVAEVVTRPDIDETDGQVLAANAGENGDPPDSAVPAAPAGAGECGVKCHDVHSSAPSILNICSLMPRLLQMLYQCCDAAGLRSLTRAMHRLHSRCAKLIYAPNYYANRLIFAIW